MGYVYDHAGPQALWKTMASVTPHYWQHMIDVTVNGTFKEAVLEQIGWPVMVNNPLPEERNVPGYEFARQSCGFAVYKDPNDIPAFVYETLGYKKPDYVEKPKNWK